MSLKHEKLQVCCMDFDPSRLESLGFDPAIQPTIQVKYTNRSNLNGLEQHVLNLHGFRMGNKIVCFDLRRSPYRWGRIASLSFSGSNQARKGRLVDALAVRGDEGRDTLR